MNTFAMKMGGCLMMVFLLMSTEAQAYRYVDSSVKQVSPDTYLLTHTYTAGFLNADSRTPIVATTDYLAAAEYPRVGFAIDGLGDDLTGVQVSALVLSNAAIANNQYLTMAGKRDIFSLVALVTLPSALGVVDDLSVSLRTLPFSYTRDGEEKSGAYNLEVAVQEDEMTLNVGK